MTQFGKATIALALSAAMIANIPSAAQARNNNAAALGAIVGLVALGAAIAHASTPKPATRTVVVEKVVTQKCHNEALPVLNSRGKQIAVQEKRVCD